jgi:hypothetical protein
MYSFCGLEAEGMQRVIRTPKEPGFFEPRACCFDRRLRSDPPATRSTGIISHRTTTPHLLRHLLMRKLPAKTVV